MNTYMVRRVLFLCVVAGGMAAAPVESQAICHWFGGGCGAQTAYRPVAPTFAAMPVAAPCNTCSPCGQTCNYMPQTCYRTVYQQVPVTSCQPVAACDPCGNRTTVMRPVITYQTQARLVPYTTFRPVYAPVSYAPSPCATGNCGTSVSYAAPVATAAPGCSSCNSGTPTYSPAPAPTYSTPAPTYSSPAPTYSPAPAQQPLGAPGSNVQSLTPTPALQPNEPTRPQTFQDDRGVTEGEERLRPIPDPQSQSGEPSNKKTNSTLTPRLLDGNDRTTYRPLKYNVIPVAAEEAEAELENDGWRPARR